MRREPDLIDVWFDSERHTLRPTALPVRKWRREVRTVFPADFIAEGVDQTRGWFFTLHALATMLFDSVAFRNIISNGLVLDRNGNKMSKRLGNAVDPFEVLSTYGPDATRWYMISNSQPWDNLKFDTEGVDEVRRKFFGTLYNTYLFLRPLFQRGRLHGQRTGSYRGAASGDRPVDHVASEYARAGRDGVARELRPGARPHASPGVRLREHSPTGTCA